MLFWPRLLTRRAAWTTSTPRATSQREDGVRSCSLLPAVPGWVTELTGTRRVSGAVLESCSRFKRMRAEHRSAASSGINPAGYLF